MKENCATRHTKSRKRAQRKQAFAINTGQTKDRKWRRRSGTPPAPLARSRPSRRVEVNAWWNIRRPKNATARWQISATIGTASRACAKANLLAMNLQKKVTDSPGKQFRFITLTLKHSDQPLSDQINRLYECFRKLRKSKEWQDTQDGGAAIFECKFDLETNEWHPHLHIVAEGFFLHHRDLSSTWLKITGDSFRVDIRVIKSARDAAFYVAKYTSKGTNDDVWQDREIAAEWVRSMHGRRSCATYGTWRGLKLLEHEPQSGEWTRIGLLTNIVQAAERCEKWAIDCIDCLRRENQYNPHRSRTKKGQAQPVVDT